VLPAVLFLPLPFILWALGFGLALLVARAFGWFQKFFVPGSFFITTRRNRAVIINA
jgi:hypothetical protein